jgi:deoxycytidine triphosphate deaminase
MVLSDRDIRKHINNGNLTIEPYKESNVEPASVDLRLGDDHRLVKRGLPPIDDELVYEDIESPLVIQPESFILTTTMERVEVPNDLVAQVEGRSSLGRLGVSVHQTAGYIDPGFEGQITLELSNHGPAPVTLSHGQRICQIVFEELSSPAEEPYGHDGSHYQNQSGATESSMQSQRL